jgi:hypothetical protein
MKSNRIMSVSMVMILVIVGLMTVAPASIADSENTKSSELANKIEAIANTLATVNTRLNHISVGFIEPPDGDKPAIIAALGDIKGKSQTAIGTATDIKTKLRATIASSASAGYGTSAGSLGTRSHSNSGKSLIHKLHSIGLVLGNVNARLDKIQSYFTPPPDDSIPVTLASLDEVVNQAQQIIDTATALEILMRP